MKTSKEMDNLEIAELLRAVAASYQLQDEKRNKFRIIAYERAADAVEHLSSEVKDFYDEGKLDEIPGVGLNIAGHLGEIFRSGKSKHFEDLMRGIPTSVFKLMELPRIGVKTAFKLVKALGLEKSADPISDLEKKAKENKISVLDGFGQESQADILEAVGESRRMIKRHLLPYAENLANEVINWLKGSKSIIQAEALGSIRRKVSTVGDIDIAVTSNDGLDAIKRFTAYPKKARVIESGKKSASILLPGNVQVDLMVCNMESFGSLLQHFTGSKHHNIALREYALKKGMSLSEYGIKKIGTKSVKKFKDEKEFYKYLGLEWIPPELREDAGEIEAAQRGKLPDLIEISDIKADLQIHSDFDVETSHDLGESSMQEIIEYANKFNYEYVAFSEHNPSRSKHKDSEIIDILKRKKDKIEEINYSIMKSVKKGVKKVYNSLEIDILPDGTLPMPEKALELIDFALISIHSSFRQSKNEASKRIIRAMGYPKVKIFAHPTGRLLNKREGVELDWPKIFEIISKRNIFLEINSDPARLDLPDFLIKEALKYKIKFSLGTDAHSIDGMDNMIYGVYNARRGWATKGDIINTKTFEEFDKEVKKL